MKPWEPTKAAHLLVLALKEVGKPYVLGSEGPPDESLRTWDCSELVQHLLAQVGVVQVTDSKGRVTPVNVFDGAGFQWERSVSIPLEAGVKLPGALLFIRSASAYPRKPHQVGHVAISLGNGYLLEARGRAYGVTIGPLRPSFNLATKVQELYAPALLG
jgi:cell wall-associated NlpC family hydrolase